MCYVYTPLSQFENPRNNPGLPTVPRLQQPLPNLVGA